MELHPIYSPISVAIAAIHVSRELSGVQAVRDVSFTAHYGKILGLLGPNGAGKTTTLKMLACLLEPSSGKLEICGHTLPAEVEQVKKHVGFMTSGMKLYEVFTPEESLFYFGRLRGIEERHLRKRIDELIAEFSMEAFCRKRFGKLSSGEQQRTTIANALLHEPKVLILDEITLSLDVMSSNAILNIVKRERDKGRCIIFSTHSMGEAEYLCDEIALIYQGRIIGKGSPEELIRQTSAANLTEAFLRSVEQAKEVAA